MASQIFALAPGSCVVGAGAVHHFADLGLLRWVSGIRQEHRTQADVIGAVAVEELWSQGTGPHLGEMCARQEALEWLRVFEGPRVGCNAPESSGSG